MSLLKRRETNMQFPELIEKWAQEKRGWREPMLEKITHAQASEVITAAQSSRYTPEQRKERVRHSKLKYYRRRKDDDR